jgi:hypothetical protein
MNSLGSTWRGRAFQTGVRSCSFGRLAPPSRVVHQHVSRQLGGHSFGCRAQPTVFIRLVFDIAKLSPSAANSCEIKGVVRDASGTTQAFNRADEPGAPTAQ